MQIFEHIVPITEYTAVALGFFDGIHSGHRAVIDRAVSCKKQGLSPAVMTFSESPRSILSGKTGDMLQTNQEKCRMLETIGVEKLFLEDFDRIRRLSPEAFVREIIVEKLNAKEVFCGFNYHFGKNGAGNGETLVKLCEKFGVKAQVIPPVIVDCRVVSSTEIRSLLKNGEIKEANRLLGYDFSISQEVIHGNHIGKDMGFPTINQRTKSGIILPKFGVYASLAEFDGEKYFGVTNVGVKPTIGKYEPLYETWMPDYMGGDLYGKTVTVALKGFIRPERKFESLDELKKTVLQNGEQARQMINLG